MNLETAYGNVSRLSAQDKAEVAVILEEMDRRDREERARTFVPCDPSMTTELGFPANDQKGFIYSTADERWAFGGNRSGKTEVTVQDCNMFCCGTHPVRSQHRKPPVKVRYCAPQWREGVVDVVLQKFKEVVPRCELRGGDWPKAWSEREHKLHYKNGSYIQFKSFEEELNTFGGANLDAVYQDEKGSRSKFDENCARLTDRNGFFASSMTPEEGITWEEDQVNDPPEGINVEHWFFDVRGNPHLNPEGVEKFLAKFKGTALYETKVMGQFAALTGLVLPQWSPAIHVIPDIEIPKHWPRVFCIDMHTRTPSAAMAAAWSPAGELYIYWTSSKFLDVPAWKAHIRAALSGDEFVLWLLDEPGNTDGKDANNVESFVNQFNAFPGPIPMELVRKDSENFFASGIYKLWEYLKPKPMSGKSRIKVFKSCDYHTERINGKVVGGLPWEMKRYCYKKEQKADEETLREKVRKVNDHLIDDLRYIVMAGPQVIQEVSTGPHIVTPKGWHPNKWTGVG